ncbi:MAG: lantibiotic dehydratase family protein [Verrucomicrobiota bacterium]|nr:lantibiotic dehydratase family protein [Verrucomicrobiota bacterium]
MAGVPFDLLERLATNETAAAARELLVRQAHFQEAKTSVEQLLHSRGHGLSEELFRAWRKAIRAGAVPPAGDVPSQAFATCWDAAAEVASAEATLDSALQRELKDARTSLLESARTVLPAYLVFVDSALRTRLTAQSSEAGVGLPARNKQARAHERHLLLYLQRVAAKNDSLSAFGPEGWGTVAEAPRGFALSPSPGIAQRHAFLERWTAHGAAAALNADPSVRAELPPRIHPAGRIEGDQFVSDESEETIALDPATIDLLDRCDGKTPAHSLGVSLDTLRALAQRKILRWEVEVPAMEPYAFDTLVADVTSWNDPELRGRWLDSLAPIAALPAKFAATTDTAERIEIIAEAERRLDQLGVARKGADRFLYSAGNPIGEECIRQCDLSIGRELLDEVATDGAPWIDLWRDCYAFAASRVAAGLRALLESAPRRDGTISFAAFLRHCEMMKAPLPGRAMVGLAHGAFSEIKAAFREHFANRTDAEEWSLTADDCHFVRNKFDYARFDEYTYPSADLQLAATSASAVERGDYQWILAELHPPIALLHHGFYWSCPDKPALNRALASTVHGQPSFHFGFFAADFTATTTVRNLDAMPDLTSFLASQRSQPRWRTISPADADVVVDPATGDVGLSARTSGEYLGSLARGAWVIPLGFHPFLFSLGTHTPRLRCGKVIVQRRSWTVALAEFPPGKYSGISRDLVLATERLRAQKNWPRYVYIRPTEQALRRSGAEGRDKDTKPVFVDFESYLFLEIFHRWLTKAGELEVTEMLPAPEHLLWQEADGRHTFELRTLMVPRS